MLFCEVLLLLWQIDITDVGNEFSVWSVFGVSHDVPDVLITNRDVILSVHDPRHRSFGRRLLLPSAVHGTFVKWLFVTVSLSVLC